MEKIRSAAREQLRRTVIRGLGCEHSQTAVATELGINRLTLHSWAARVRQLIA